MKNIYVLLSFIFLCNQLVIAQEFSRAIKDNNNFRVVEEYLIKNSQVFEKASEKEIKMYERWRWFWSSRVDSSGNLTKYAQAMHDYYNKYYLQYQKQDVPVLNLKRSSIQEDNVQATVKSSSVPTWELIGPYSRPAGSHYHIGRGRIRSIWVNPSDFDNILVGASSGGLWKTNDGGTNWSCLTDEQPIGGVTDIAVHPTNNNIIYIATGLRANGSIGNQSDDKDGYSLGIFKTTDGGNSWVNCNVPATVLEYFRRVLIDPENSNTIYAMSDATVYKSTNAGASWVDKNVPFTSDDYHFLRDMEIKPGDSDILFLSGNNVLFRSTNGGDNWSQNLESNLHYPADSTVRIEIAVHGNDLYVLLCDLYNPTGLPRHRLEKSSDNGNLWTLLNSTYDFKGRGFALVIEVSPNGDIYTGGRDLFKVTNNGSSIQPLMSTADIHVDFMDISFPDASDNNLIYVTNDGGVYMDDAGGSSWDRINGNLATNEFYEIAITEEDPEIMVGGTHDCGSYRRDVDGNWSFVRGGDGGTSIIDPSNKNIYYVSSTGGFWRYENGISTYIYNLEGLDAPVGVHPTNSNVVFLHDWKDGAPYVRVMKGTKNGSIWTMDTVDREWDHLRNIEISKSNPQIMYYTMWDPWTSARIRKSTNGGDDWREISSYNGIYDICQESSINDIWISPEDPNFILVAFGGFSDEDKVAISVTGGDVLWASYSGLPDLPVQSIAYDIKYDRIIAGTDVGIFYRSMQDASWHLDTDFPQTIISDIEINETSDQIVVSTYGRGIWRTEREHFCKDESPIVISSTINWNSERGICPNVTINNGGHLTISDKVTLSRFSSITVANGGFLTITQDAELHNADIIVESGGSVTINSNGKVYLNEGDNFQIDIGATANIEYGSIEPN